MKRFILVATTFCLMFASTPSFAISEAQKGSISQHCGTIQQSLNRLQKADSRTRVYLGRSYELFLTNFITPLNLRLLKNNQSSDTLIKQQSQFSDLRTQFNDAFTDYMKELGTLSTTNCKTQPEDFYQRLKTVRYKRSTLHDTTKNISQLLSDHLITITNFEDSL